MQGLFIKRHPDLIVGGETADDAGVFRLTDELALVQTLDFFTPIVDDPFDFGRIAAANALSDVYAMGGTPLTAMNIVCFPKGDLPLDILRQTLLGGLEKIEEAGAALAGGHSVDDREFKYGLSVTGIVHPARVLKNNTARVGDRLILTKPLGTGVIATGIKAGLAGPDAVALLVETAAALNKTAAQVAANYNISACTDVTGFGLAGHALEMAAGSGVLINLFAEQVPCLPGTLELATMGLVPAGAHNMRNYCAKKLEIAPGVALALADLMFDPQTSGGLLLAIDPAQANDCALAMQDKGLIAKVIGRVEDRHPGGKIFIRP
jgi:selenide,water dikinase